MAYEDIIQSASKEYRIDSNLIKAFIKTESNWDPKASRYEPKIKDTSYGLMQVLLKTGRWVSKNRKLTAKQLTQPTVNILIGTRYLRQLSDKYPKLKDVIASYNAGKPYKTRTGKYVNQKYVDKVVKYYYFYGKSWFVYAGLGIGAAILFILYKKRPSLKESRRQGSPHDEPELQAESP